MMKERRGSSAGAGERFAVFPFSMGCMSQSALSVADPSEKKPQGGHPLSSSSSSSAAAAASTTTTTTAQTSSSDDGAGAGAGGEAVGKETRSAGAAATPPGLVAAGVSRLMKGIRSLSQMFAAYDDDGEEEEEEEEMVIGYPTDVQHVGHIGWDGSGHSSSSSSSMVQAGAMGMVNAFSLPSSLSLRHLETMAMDHAATA